MAKEGVRIIPRVADPITDLVTYAGEQKWELRKALGRDDQTATPGEIAYFVPDSENWIILRDDGWIEFKFISVLGPQPDALVHGIRQSIDSWSEDEILARWDRASQTTDVDEAIDAILNLGVGSPVAADTRYAERLNAALLHSDARVRNAAIGAAAYADWRSSRPALERIREHDPDQKARERAAFVLDGWAKSDA
jgi:hypothetical protein